MYTTMMLQRWRGCLELKNVNVQYMVYTQYTFMSPVSRKDELEYGFPRSWLWEPRPGSPRGREPRPGSPSGREPVPEPGLDSRIRREPGLAVPMRREPGPGSIRLREGEPPSAPVGSISLMRRERTIVLAPWNRYPAKKQTNYLKFSSIFYLCN